MAPRPASEIFIGSEYRNPNALVAFDDAYNANEYPFEVVSIRFTLTDF